MNLDIYLAGEHVASTIPRSRGQTFVISYTDSALDGLPAESILLSCSLPTPGPSKPAIARAFLEGLLPEGQALETMAARVRGVRLTAHQDPEQPTDVVNLLAEYGRECAGAAVLMPAGQSPPQDGDYRRLDTGQVSTLIASLPESPLGADLTTDVRLSLAGNQPKLLLARFDGAWFEPTAGAATTHIVKPTGAWPLSADNETIVMRIARSLDLTPSHTWVEEFDGVRALVTERFDRVIDPTARIVRRRHQEDMCQALGMRPRDKYAIGRPSQRMARLLRSVPTAPGTDARKLFEQSVFRAIVGDEDGHGKNYGLLIEDGQVSLSPLYDSLITLVYPELSGNMGAGIADKHNLTGVDLDALVDEGRACGIDPDEATRIVLDLADNVGAATRHLDQTGIDPRALQSVTVTISARITALQAGRPMGPAPRGTALGRPARGVSATMDAATRRKYI